LPIIGIFKAPAKPVSDHYTYLPAIGISVMMAWGIPLLFSNDDYRKKILFPVSFAMIIILSFLTWQQCGHWKNNITLFSHALQVTKENAIAHNFLARDLDKQGRFNESLYHFDEAIRIIPDYADAYFNKGNVYVKIGQYQQAIQYFNEAIRIKPHYADAYNCLGSAYAEMGQYQKAIQHFTEAIKLKNNLADAYYNRGLTYVTLHQYQLALDDFNESIRMKPIRDAYHNRGVLYLNDGYVEFGCTDARKACDLGNCSLLKDAIDKNLCR